MQQLVIRNTFNISTLAKTKRNDLRTRCCESYKLSYIEHPTTHFCAVQPLRSLVATTERSCEMTPQKRTDRKRKRGCRAGKQVKAKRARIEAAKRLTDLESTSAEPEFVSDLPSPLYNPPYSPVHDETRDFDEYESPAAAPDREENPQPANNEPEIIDLCDSDSNAVTIVYSDHLETIDTRTAQTVHSHRSVPHDMLKLNPDVNIL